MKSKAVRHPAWFQPGARVLEVLRLGQARSAPLVARERIIARVARGVAYLKVDAAAGLYGAGAYRLHPTLPRADEPGRREKFTEKRSIVPSDEHQREHWKDARARWDETVAQRARHAAALARKQQGERDDEAST